MKTKHLFLVVLTAAGIASCKQQPLPQEEPHQIESIAELFDSLTARDKSAWCFLSCSEDSVLTESYQASISMPDTTDINKHDEEYKRYIRQWIQDYDFALQNATRLFDELCPKAEKSYRYTSKDSLDYSITLSSCKEIRLNISLCISVFDLTPAIFFTDTDERVTLHGCTNLLSAFVRSRTNINCICSS